MAENVGGKDGASRSGEVVSQDLPDKLWNIDTGGTRLDARRVIAEKTARACFQRHRGRQRRIDFGKIFFELLRRELWARMHESPMWLPAASFRLVWAGTRWVEFLEHSIESATCFHLLASKLKNRIVAALAGSR